MNEQNNSFQQWLDRSIKASERMATDEKFRQEVAKRVTPSREEIQALIAKHGITTQVKK